MEVEFVVIDPGSGFTREEIVVPDVPRSHELEPLAMRAGGYLFLSGIATENPGSTSGVLAVGGGARGNS